MKIKKKYYTKAIKTFYKFYGEIDITAFIRTIKVNQEALSIYKTCGGKIYE